MRALSLGQAGACEMAEGPVCRCRCRGAFHGAARNGGGEEPVDRAWFEELADDDPHRLPKPGERYTFEPAPAPVSVRVRRGLTIGRRIKASVASSRSRPTQGQVTLWEAFGVVLVGEALGRDGGGDADRGDADAGDREQAAAEGDVGRG
jgi:hypothetical protein